MLLENLESRCLFSVAVPTGLTAVAESPFQVKVSWNPNRSDGSGGFLHRLNRTSGGKFQDELIVLDFGISSYTDTTQASSRYSYFVTTFGLGGDSPPSKQFTLRTPKYTGVPFAPTALSATPTTDRWKWSLHWIDNSSNEDTFLIYQTQTPNDEKSWKLTTRAGDHYLYGATRHTVNVPKSEVPTYYRVVAYSKKYGTSTPATW
jgi:hypothetical protein